MVRSRVKICGITRSQDARAAVEAGADAIGLVFYAGSSRCVEIDQAVEIVRGLPPFVARIALFVDASVQAIEQVLTHLPIDAIQFHGNESPAFCHQFGVPFIKAIRMRSAASLVQGLAQFSLASAFLLDSYRADQAGGTGASFDWSLFPQQAPAPCILAGGLHAGNVAQAIDATAAYAVDVSSGVESQPGIKSAELMREFVQQVIGLAQ